MIAIHSMFHLFVEEGSCVSDVGFVVDVSGSVFNFWDTEIEFVKKLAEKINLSPDGGHAAVTKFNGNADLIIKFSDHYSLPPFESAVDAIASPSGGTNIGLGLSVAYNEMFQVSNGMRLDAPKTLVLITDGRGGTGNLATWKATFEAAGIRPIVIGIGNNINAAVLANLVSSPSDLHLSPNPDDLLTDEFIRNITLCDGKSY